MNDKIKNMLQNAYENNYDPSDVMTSVSLGLEKYFLNKDKLKRYRSNSDILSAFEFEIRYNNEPEFSEGIFEVLKCYRDAYREFPKETINIFSSTLFDSSEKENHMWTVKTSSPQWNENDIHDSVISHMNHIGNILEIRVKYIVQELYAMIRLSKRLSVDFEKVRTYDFGVLIHDILSSGCFENLLKTEPIAIKLSDWRNIAYHHSYRIQENSITCSYGKNPVKHFDVRINDFLPYCHKIIRACNVFSIARSIFIFDNINKLASIQDEVKPDIFFRKPLLIEQLSISIISQGFVLDSYEEDEKEVTITLIDLNNNGNLSFVEIQKRQIHASQLLYNIWCVFKKNIIKINYCNQAKRKDMCLSVTEDICNDILSGKPISSIAKHIIFNKIF